MPVKKVYENENGVLVRICNICKITQPTENFYMKRMNQKLYPLSKCKQCMKMEYMDKCKDKIYKYKKIPIINVY